MSEYCFPCFSAEVLRLPTQTLVSKQQDFNLSFLLKEQIDQRAQVDELVGSILSDLLEKAVKKATLARRRENYRARQGEESDEEVVILPTREDGELTSSEDDKLAGFHCKNSVKSLAIARLQSVKRSRQLQAAYATLQEWRASNCGR